MEAGEPGPGCGGVWGEWLRNAVNNFIGYGEKLEDTGKPAGNMKEVNVAAGREKLSGLAGGELARARAQ